ncbi:MAG: site-2 protease family protein [Chloroflexota bacterium]|nr:MAG: site-2 protease family protein [Chloroflexota bacterium]
MRYLPPILRGSRFGGSPGQIVILAVIVLVALLMFGGDPSPEGLARSARDLAVLLVAFVASLTLHEYAHASVATLLGDDTARRMGRLTLDPRAHLDPLGTFMMVMTLILGFGLGWARPVPVNAWRLRPGPRVGMAIVAIAGPLMNLVLAFAAIRLSLGLVATGADPVVKGVLNYFALINVVLAIFNMLPIPPLDGFRVLVGILPEAPARSVAAIEPYGPMILLLVIFMGSGLVGGIIRGVGYPLMRAMGSSIGGFG